MTAPDRPPQTGRPTRAAAAFLLAAALFLFAARPSVGLAQETPAQPRPVEEILSYADLLYSKEQFGLAAQQYSLFIREQPNSPNLQIAWFRLGECYLKVEQTADAVATFNHLINTYRKGPFVGSAAYRLAVLRFNDKDHRNALAYFKLAKDELVEAAAKLQARFYYARCLQLTGQGREALAHFEQVMSEETTDENPFLERSLLESARILFEMGETEKSLERFRTLGETASTPAFREEAIVRGGLMAAEAGQPEVSEALLSEALKFPNDSPWKPLAQVGAIFNAFTRGDHDRVIALYNTGSYTPPDESRAKMLLVVGHSFRIKGDNEAALRLYSLVEGRYGDRPEGVEAGYRRLQILHQQKDPGLPTAAQIYAERQAKNAPSNPYIDMAWLMAGEWHFAQAEGSAGGTGSEFARSHYKEAANAYRRVRPEKVDEKFHEARLYKQGWSEIESGQRKEGIQTLSSFVERHPRSALASSALAKRAMAYQEQEDHQFALDDYLALAERYPDAPELEFALQQIALIYAHQRKIPEMIGAYGTLLEKFPDTKGAGEARYWIGVGHFDLQEYAEAAVELDKARGLDPSLDDKATLRLVIAHYHLDDISALAAESRHYLENAPAEDDAKRPPIPEQVLEFLGSKLAEAKEYEDAEFFLSTLADDANPERTSAAVWKLLADARSRLRKHAEAIVAYDNFLVQTERPSERAAAYLNRGRAQLCLREFDAARNSAQESLRSQKEGRTNAEARILLGDISAAEDDLEEAAKEYLVVSQIFTDPEITPRALAKAIDAYRSLGNQPKAQELTQQLSAAFPDYVPPASLAPEC